MLEIVEGKSTSADIARHHGNITAGEIQGSLDEFLEIGEEWMRARPRDLEVQFEAKQKESRDKIGEQLLQIDELKNASLIGQRASTRNRVKIAHGQMASDAKDVAVARLCRWLGVTCSTVY